MPVALVQGVQATIGCRVSRPGLAPPPSAAELALLLSHREGNPPLQLAHLLSD